MFAFVVVALIPVCLTWAYLGPFAALGVLAVCAVAWYVIALKLGDI